MNIIKNHIKLSLLCGALAVLGGRAEAAITYVDVTNGVSGNTMQIATNGTTPWNGTLQVWNPPNNSAGAINDSIWNKRTPFANLGTIYENAGNASVDTNATRLVTSLAVPAPGLGQYYNIYVLFWTDTSLTWRVGASLTNFAGQLPIYQLTTAGVTRFYNGADATVNSTSLAPNPFTTSVMIAEGNRRLLMTPVLGQVYGTNITVYLEPDRNHNGSNERTWIDGVGYELIANKILTASILSNRDLSMTYSGTAGRQYLWERTDSLEPPVIWDLLVTSIASSAGLVSFTNTPSGPQEFYRVHDVTPPPPQVINLTATAGIAQVSLSWTASAGATSYAIKMATSSGGPYITNAIVSGTTFVNTGLINGTTYYFVVSAQNFNGEGANSAEASATPFPPQPPVAPTILTAIGGNNLVSLSWTASSSATSYNIKRATSSGGPYTTNNVTGTSLVSTGLVNGTTYYFVVSALNIYGESADSPEANATPAPVPPLPPTGLTVTASNAQVTLSWMASAGATSYNVKSATVSGGPYTTNANVTATSFVNTDLVNDTKYYFVVSALNDYGESADSSEKNATPFDTPPLVFDVEFRGSNYALPPLPTLASGDLPFIQPLPDPFAWANDPTNGLGTRSTDFNDWSHHRAEIKAQIENYEIGYKPPVDPAMIFASVSGTGTSRTLTVRVTNMVNGTARTLTLTSAIGLPASSGTFPAIIGMNSPNGSINLGGRAIATINYQHNQVTTYGSPANSNPYYLMYAAPYSPALNIDNTGQYSAWAWGCSRLIDGLYKLNGDLGGGVTINLQRIGVTGCSYAGKMALFCGAFDERVALTIPQESGGGGAPNWRYSATEPSGTVEWLANTDHNWFSEGMFAFGSVANVGFLPEDHHELMAMVAPRALFATGNPDGAVWLSNPSCYVSCRAAERVYQTFGVSDRLGWNINGGKSHCSLTADVTADVGAFLDKFLLNLPNVNTITNRHVPATYTNIDYVRWTAWWGSTNAVFP